MSGTEIPPEARTAMRVQLFHEWLCTLPSVMERAGLTADQLAERNRRAAELMEQFDALGADGSV